MTFLKIGSIDPLGVTEVGAIGSAPVPGTLFNVRLLSYGTNLVSIGRDRLYWFTRQPKLEALVEEACRGKEMVRSEVLRMLDMWALNVPAPTDVLDKLGGIFQRPRVGLDDVAYQKLLGIHLDLVLTSNGAANVYLEAIERYTGQPATAIGEFFPLGFLLGVVATGTDLDILVDVLDQARPACYAMIITHSADSDVLLVDSSGANTVTDPGSVGTTGTATIADDYPITGARFFT